MLYLFSIGFISGVISFVSKHKHFLLTLLSIEFLVLFFFILIFFMFSTSFTFFSLIYITFSACEGALGLSILISLARLYGSDTFSSFSLTN